MFISSLVKRNNVAKDIFETTVNKLVIEAKPNPIVKEVKEEIKIPSNVMRNVGQYTCPNFRYINRIVERRKSLMDDAEVFINPITQQKVYVSDQGMFLSNGLESLNPLLNFGQIKKKDKKNPQAVFVILIIGITKKLFSSI